MSNSKIHIKTSVLAFLKLIRSVNLIILAFTQYMGRYFIIGKGEDSIATIIGDGRFFILVLCTVFVAAAGYIINDYYDIKIDLINKPKRVVLGKILHRRIALISHTILNVLACVLAVFLGKEIFIIILSTTILMWFYANQLKRIALLGNILIAALTGIAVYLPALLYTPYQQILLLYASFAFFISLIREIIKDMEDVKGDEEFGCKTLPIVWGIRKTKNFIYLIGLLCICSICIILYFADSTIQLYFLLLPAPLFVWLGIRLFYADTSAQFLSLSNFCKWIMLVGVISMVFL
ncbi:geranylgeranylglycerol-phosphate geranylgeranyltransferase [uncultured Cytophaga sp.]|uniref:geranylgeranylglycerol-phosphate geranylgeranyltransferase n=1 Tax=uncultured Cytophaga sp. TaxID=160238 RepID=UPI002620CD46|nr:geranylgeranylglycerol-phosphate geranylgeranyltransferase [uncultured Cytophaga sp.]